MKVKAPKYIPRSVASLNGRKLWRGKKAHVWMLSEVIC